MFGRSYRGLEEEKTWLTSLIVRVGADSARVAEQEPAGSRVSGPTGAGALEEDSGGERDHTRHSFRVRRANNLALHHHAGGDRYAVVCGDRVRGAVYYQHGGRALHFSDRRDGGHRLHALLEAVGGDLHPWGDPAQCLAGLGDERGHAANLHLWP